LTETLPAEQILEDQLNISVGFATDVGGRTENEDALHVAELPPLPNGDLAGQPGLLLAIADGMGGHQRGEVASSLAVETIRDMFSEDPGADAALLLKQAFRRANERIYENGHDLGENAMMGTTLVVAATRGKYATIASIGDSRAYLIRANRVNQITQDHSLVAEQVAQGAMSAEEARESPHRNILIHALGHRAKLDPRMPSVFEITLLPEDRLLLCTDGFYDVASDEDLLHVASGDDPQNAAQALVNTAVERGATDNVTAIVATVASSRVREHALAAEVVTGERSNLVSALFIAAIAAFVVLVVVLFLLLS
jgi:serine/threonine protein phosphatase PrpC